MAALLGTNTALLLFQGIEQAKSPDNVREFALAVIAAALPFQAIYFLIYTFVLEHEPQLLLALLVVLCQLAGGCGTQISLIIGTMTNSFIIYILMKFYILMKYAITSSLYQ